MSETAEQTTQESGPVTYRTGQALLAEFEASGAEKAFEEIVRLYAGMVYSVCQQVTKNAHDAEDATQATFLALATQVKLGKHVKCLGPWLRQVAKRTSLDLCKSRKRREKREANHNQFAGQDRFNGNLGEANLESQDYKTALHDELNKLPPRYRLPLVMHYFGGLPPEQTALELNCKPKTLAVRLHRGRKMLAAQLSRRGIFMGGEMLGIASAPFMFNLMGASSMHSTAHAAVGITSGMDITTLISTRVMGLIQTTAKATILAKIKFLAVIAVLATTMLAGAARAGFQVLPSNFHLPAIHLSEWLKPLVRAFTPRSRMIAQATAPASDALSAQNTNVYAMNAPRPTAFSKSTGVSFASYDVVEHGDYETLSMSPANSPLASAGSMQLRRSAGTSLTNNETDLVSMPMAGNNLPMSIGESPLVQPATAPITPTPEPFGLAAVALGGSLFLRRRSITPAK